MAASGVSFTRAYCAAPACNPSRAALMSGRRPSTTGIYRNPDPWKERIPSAETLNVHFRSAGYYTAAAGKIYHGGVGRRADWDSVYERTKQLPRGKVLSQGAAGKLAYAQLGGGDEVMRDYHVVSWTIEQLEREHEKPFFLACGIFRPHLPWNVPKKYFDLYPLESKFALWEEPTRAPLIWRAPGVTHAGGLCHHPVDFMNIYPTLCDLAGIDIPGHCEGVSLRPLLERPEADWVRPAITTHGYLNHAIRLRDWRLIRYADGSEELYDRDSDPLEYTNLAGSAEHEGVLSELRDKLPKTNAAPGEHPAAKKPKRQSR